MGRRLYSHEVEEFFGVHASSDEDDTLVFRRPLFSLDTVIEVQTLKCLPPANKSGGSRFAMWKDETRILDHAVETA